MISRRGLLTGLISFVAAPAIVRIENIMPIRPLIITRRDPWVSFQSWLPGTPTPFPCVEGYDLLSRARRLCEMTSETGVVYIRGQHGTS